MQATAPSILFLIPYFGQWPFWMPLFLKSCEHNPDINWLLIGDCGEPDGLPANVRYRYSSFADYCDLVSERLGLSFHPTNPYKLCDLKPAYGFIHQEDIQGYDFWGFGDLDLIYGDLRAYFTAEKLKRYDFFSTHERRVSGHLCVMRNNEHFRTLFWRIPDFHKRIEDHQHHALDEGGFTRLFLWRKNFPKPLFKFVGLFNPLRRVAEFREAFSTPYAKVAWIDGGYDFPQRWYWSAGHLTNDTSQTREFPYFHFVVWKSLWKHGKTGDAAHIARLASDECWSVDSEGFHSRDV